MTVEPKGLLIDIVKCIGCGACSENCKKVNDLPGKIDDSLKAQTWTVVRERQKGVFVRNLCHHCVHPACVASCPVSALEKTVSGAIVYDKSRCLGCRYCMIACPYQVPTFEWHSPTPRIRKCILCEPRISKGLSTGCAEACPTEATVFGSRKTLIELAKARMAASPDKYFKTIYGLDEAGGSSVIYISPVPFERLGFETRLPDYPLSDITWRILKQIPAVVGTGACLLGGSYFFFKRREEVKKAEGQNKGGDK